MRSSWQFNIPPVSPTVIERTNPHIDLSAVQLPHARRASASVERIKTGFPPETWYEPREVRDGTIRLVTEDPGRGYIHAVTVSEIIDYFRFIAAPVAAQILRNLCVIKLSGRTRKNERHNLYGMQWGSSVYLYPYNESLTESYQSAPRNDQRIQAERYGGKWTRTDQGTYLLSWTRQSLRDFYLCEVLMHEFGHLLDNRNTGFIDRERFADAFAAEHGYLPWKSRQPEREIVRRHHYKRQG